MTRVDTQKSLRQKALRARRSLSPETRARFSHSISRSFLGSSFFWSASRIGVFLSMPDEVDTSEIILRCWRANKRAFVPVTDQKRRMQFVELTPDTRLQPKQFGILEPISGRVIDAKELDVALVPLAAFDASGNRIGMGGGYYDRAFRFLRHRQLWKKPRLLGLAFSCQRVEKIPVNPWDIPLCGVLHEHSGQ